MISKAFRLGRRHMGVRLAVCAVVMIALLANTATPIYAAGGEVGSIQGTVVDSVTHAGIAGASVSLSAPTN